MRNIRAGARMAALATLGVAAGFSVLPANAAYADGDYRWATANDYGNGYLFLEVLNSRTDPLAPVITFPSNSGSANQWWSDFKMNNGRYKIINYNSSLALDRWDSHTGPGSDGGCSSPMVYYGVNEPQQHWGYRTEWSNYYNRSFTRWVNKAGCSGDLYHDTLSVNYTSAAGYGLETTLFHANRCVYGDSAGVYHRCYWRRNGE